ITWLNVGVDDGKLFPQNFAVFRMDRDFTKTKLSRGGGVLLAINKIFTSSLVNLDNTSFKTLHEIDVIAVKVLISDTFLIVFNIYNPPSLSSEYFGLIVEAFCSIEHMYHSNIVITGDFNIPEYS